MTKYIDPHTILTAVIILALTALAIAKVQLPPWLPPLLATISPGIVFQKPATDQPKDPPVVPPGVSALGLLALALGSALVIVACTPGEMAAIKTSEDVARAECAAFAAAKKSITIEEAFRDFCSAEENYGPFLPGVKEKQAAGKAGTTLKVAALPGDCAEVQK